ncbi:MAG: antitoxin [Pseudobdellovibrionaceae bacterium]
MRKAKAAVRKYKNNDDFEAEDNGLPTAKLFQNGRSQAVRLPKEYRFEGPEIGVGRVGNAVILYPLNDPWGVFFEGAEELSQAKLGPLKREQGQTKRRFEK